MAGSIVEQEEASSHISKTTILGDAESRTPPKLRAMSAEDPMEGDATSVEDPEEIKALLLSGMRRHLQKRFHKIFQRPPVAHFKVLTNAPNSGLTIDGFGDISFPLAVTDIGKIKFASGGTRKEAMPSNSDDIRIWEVPGHLWQTTNPSWGPFLQKVCQQIEVGLQIPLMQRGLLLKQRSLILYGIGSRVGPSSVPQYEVAT